MSYYELEHRIKQKQAEFENYIEAAALRKQAQTPHHPTLKLDISLVGLEVEFVVRRKPQSVNARTKRAMA